MQNEKPNMGQIDFLFSKIAEGFAYCKIILDEGGKPVDWVYLDVNEAYERINGVNKAEVVGKKATEVLPNIESDPADWINLYGKVALTGEPVVTELYAAVRDKWYHISAYSPQKEYFVSLFEDITERKKAEGDIRKAKDDWERTFNAVPDLIAVLDTNYRIIRANKAMAEQLGVIPEKAVGLICYECVHGTTAPPDNCPHAQLLKDSQQHTAELHEPRLGGDFVVSATPLKDQEGRLAGSIHVARNITERKKVENALKENEAKYRSLFTNMMDGFAHCKMIFNDEGKPVDFIYLDVNDAFEKLTGLKKEAVIGKRVSEAIPGTIEANPELIDTYGRVATTRKSERFEIYFKPLNTWFSVSVYSEQKGYFIAIFQNVTERKQAEEALRESEQRWSTTLTSIGDAVIATNTEGKITFMNPVAETLTGWTLGEVKQKPIQQVFNIINEHTRREVESPVTKVLREGLIVGLANHTVLKRKDGTEVPIDDSGAPIVTEDGAIRGVVLVFRDITERKKTEEKIARQSLMLESANDAIIGYDINRKITFWNKAAEKMYGYTSEEVIGKVGFDVFKTELVNLNQNDLFSKLRTQKHAETESIRTTKNGERHHIETHAILLCDEASKPIGFVTVDRDVTERKQTEESLKRQAALIDLSPDAIIVRSPEGHITFWSKGAEKLYGWTKKEAIEKTTHTLFKTQFPEPFESITAKLKADGRWSGELVHQTKKGNKVTVQSWWLAEQTEHGQIKSILESNVDLTERKKAEQEIAQAKQRLDAHMDNSPEAVIEFDPEFRVIRWSEQATRVFGWSREEILGKSIGEIPWVYKDDAEIVQKISVDLLNGTRPCNVSYNRNYRKDGSIIDCEWYNSAIYDAEGHLISILSQVLDITDRMQAEKEIARLASFPMLNPSPVIEVDVTNKITFINPATKRLFPDLEGEGLNHIFFFNWTNVRKAFEAKKTDAFGREVKINNHWYHQQFYLVPQTQLIRIYATDIDELKQTEEARAKAQVKLEENAVMLEEYASQMEELAEQRAQQLQNAERMAAIGQTAGMVGHDIRNPLQAITSDMYLITEEVKSMTDKESKQAIMESIESVNQNLTYINKIVSDLQDYTRPLKPNLQDANLSELIEGTLLAINVPKGIEVTTNIRAIAKPIKTDAAYMRRILTNLMTNAVQAMQDQGKLTIQATKHQEKTVISVEDTGDGIPEEVKAKMFTPLFTTKSKGQGLGLAVVKRLVDALNGTIQFESEPGKGTKFTVTFPQKTSP